MAKNKNRYDVSEELSASSAFLIAGNIYLDAADLAYKSDDTELLLDAGDRILKLAAILFTGTDMESISQGLQLQTEFDEIEDDVTEEDLTDVKTKVRAGFIQ